MADFEKQLRQYVEWKRRNDMRQAIALHGLAEQREGESAERKRRGAALHERPRCDSREGVRQFVDEWQAHFALLRHDSEWERHWDEIVAKRVILDEAVHAAVDDGCELRYPRPATLDELVTWCKGAASNRKQKQRRRASNRKLTAKQLEVIQVVGECESNIAEAARRLGKDRKTVKEQYDAGMKKLGLNAGTLKPKTKGMSTDRRGQADIADDDEGQGVNTIGPSRRSKQDRRK